MQEELRIMPGGQEVPNDAEAIMSREREKAQNKLRELGYEGMLYWEGVSDDNGKYSHKKITGEIDGYKVDLTEAHGGQIDGKPLTVGTAQDLYDRLSDYTIDKSSEERLENIASGLDAEAVAQKLLEKAPK